MKKHLLYTTILIAAILFSSCKSGSNGNDKADSTKDKKEAADKPGGRFQNKAGILHLNMTMSMGDMKATITKYWTDYGKTERDETTMKMMGQNIASNTLNRDGWIYSWSTMLPGGTKMKVPSEMSADNIDWSKMSADMMKNMGVKKEGSGEVIGKTCDIYQMDYKGMKGKYWV